jgi:hypothetical protein
LDSLVRIVTSQWVMSENRETFVLSAFPDVRSAEMRPLMIWSAET